jgi:UDP-N-acetylglucosamine:LPS N-acetylglucosamine transferase
MKICIVSSSGGHLTEVNMFEKFFKKYSYYYVLNYKIDLSADMKERTYFISHSERDIKFIFNLYEAYKILSKNIPHVILSTGAGPVVPFALVGRFLFGCHVIFIETLTAVKRPSLTGRLMYYLSNEFYYQWDSLVKYYPRGIYGGPLI